jgi:hypothetical protein
MPVAHALYSCVPSTVEAYELTTQGGSTDFARLIAACESFGPYCLDADLVAIAASLPALTARLDAQGVANFGFSSPPTNGTRPSRPDRWMRMSWGSE